MRGLATLADRAPEARQWNDTSYPWFSPGTNTVVTEISAFNLSAVWACETLIADAIATLPVDTYRKNADERIEVPSPDWLEQPNPDADRVVYDKQRLFSLLGWGNAYSLLIRAGGTSDPNDPIVERWSIDPNCMEIRKIDGRYTYFYDGRVLPTGNVQHIANHVLPGQCKGMSVIAHGRTSMGLTFEAEQAAEKVYANGMMPGGILEVPAMPAEVSDDVIEKIQDGVIKWVGGARNAGKPLVVTGGTTWKQMMVNPADAQFLETRKFQLEEVCRWFRVPPHKIQDITQNASQGGGNGLEQMDSEFANDTLRPLTVILERADSKLLRPATKYVRYNVDAYVRTDLNAQIAYFRAGREWGWLSANDIRKLKDDKPIVNGDIYLQPLNFSEAGAEPPAPAAPPPPPQQNAVDPVTVNIAPPEVRVEPQIHLDAPITVEPAHVTVQPAAVNVAPPPPAQVHVDAPVVHVDVQPPTGDEHKRLSYDDEGRVSEIVTSRDDG